MNLAGLLLLAIAVLGVGLRHASAADPRYPDWPCTQAKVPDISIAAVWDGPPIDDAQSVWKNDPAIEGLVTRLAARRVPLADAKESIAAFITGAAGEKARKGVLLFAGLFDTLNHQRTEVMDGLERLQRREKDLAERIKGDVAALRELQDQQAPDETRIKDLNSSIEWSTRIFDDRRRSVKYACEVPTIIERRLFALARAIRQEMD
jgi:hypothetical protein